VGPPPGVLPPPQSAPWPPQQGQYAPGPMQGSPQGMPYPGQQYPPQWQPCYGGPGQFNGFQPPRKRGGPLRLVLLGFVLLTFIGVSVAVLAALLGSSGTDTTAE